MKRLIVPVIGLSIFFIMGSGCSLKQFAFRSMANVIAPQPYARKQPAQPRGAIIALTGEDDIQLVTDVFPAIVKTYEMLYLSDPSHRGLALMSGSLYIMYANAFVQTPADYISETEFEKKNAEYIRAKKFYLRGALAVVQSLGIAYPFFYKMIDYSSEAKIRELLGQCVPADVESLYWAGSGFLGAFALDPLDSNTLQKVPAAVTMLERAAELNPQFNEGAIWEVLAAFYAAAPEAMGGGAEKALYAYNKALELSKGDRPSVYVLYAQSFCVPQQDSEGFDEALQKALAINPDDYPGNKFAITISQQKARWLLQNKPDFFL